MPSLNEPELSDSKPLIFARPLYPRPNIRHHAKGDGKFGEFSLIGGTKNSKTIKFDTGAALINIQRFKQLDLAIIA